MAGGIQKKSPDGAAEGESEDAGRGVNHAVPAALAAEREARGGQAAGTGCVYSSQAFTCTMSC